MRKNVTKDTKRRTPAKNAREDGKSTEELNHEIQTATDIDDYLEQNREHLLSCRPDEHLAALLAQKGLSRAEVVRNSQLDRAYVYQIFAGQKNPSRDKLLALAFGMRLNDRETQRLLKLSGKRELYARDERDSLILFALQKDKTLIETNELLFCHGFALLGNMPE